MTEPVKVGELVEDLDIFPRRSVSDVRIDDMCYALDAGKVLPPILADRATRKIVDGIHRHRAYLKRLSAEAVIEAEFREFASNLEMLLESARVNAPQGMPLGRVDQSVVYIKAKQLVASDADIADVLGVTTTRLVRVQIRQANSSGGPVPLPHGTEHLGGSYLSDEQVAELRRQRGATTLTKVRELAGLLNQDLAPLGSDPVLRQELATLAGLITEKLAAY
jgi:hypothetical protein